MEILTWMGGLLLCLAPCFARADGGVVRLREAQGPFVITVFTPSEPVSGMATDVSVMVQRRSSGDAILDASVGLLFTAPDGDVIKPVEQLCGQPAANLLNLNPGLENRQMAVTLTRKQASNKLLYGALVKFPFAGSWRLQAFVQQGGEAVKLTCDIPVKIPPRQLQALFPYLALPLLLIGLFAINQWLRRDSLAKQ